MCIMYLWYLELASYRWSSQSPSQSATPDTFANLEAAITRMANDIKQLKEEIPTKVTLSVEFAKLVEEFKQQCVVVKIISDQTLDILKKLGTVELHDMLNAQKRGTGCRFAAA